MSTSGGNPFKIQGWFKPSSGVSLFFGSHSRHRVIRLTNSGSGSPRSFTITYLMRSSLYERVRLSLVGGGTAVSCSLNYSNRCFRVERDSTLLFGMPITSMIRPIYSRSFVPGKRGNPVYNSIMMHPKLHMSICYVYGNSPSIMSGAR